LAAEEGSLFFALLVLERDLDRHAHRTEPALGLNGAELLHLRLLTVIIVELGQVGFDSLLADRFGFGVLSRIFLGPVFRSGAAEEEYQCEWCKPVMCFHGRIPHGPFIKTLPYNFDAPARLTYSETRARSRTRHSRRASKGRQRIPGARCADDDT